MNLWAARLRAALAAAACREAWRLPPRAALGLLRELRQIRPVRAQAGFFTHINCPPFPSPAFSAYLRGLRRLARGEWTPLAAHVSVTGRCVNRCARCSDPAPNAPDPGLPQLKAAAAALESAGTASVALTGGEPLLRPDLPEIVSLFRTMAPAIFTTGHGLTRARADELRRAGLCAAFVSLDHASPEEHDRGRARAGAFDEACRAISIFRAAGFYTAAQAVAGPALLRGDALDSLLALCLELKVHDVVLLEQLPGRNEDCPPAGPQERARLAALHERSMRDASLPKITAMSFMESPEKLGCQAGFGFLYVAATGDVCPCDFVPLSFGNLYREPWPEISGRLTKYFARPRRTCLACVLRQRARPGGIMSWKETESFCGNLPSPESASELLEGFIPPAAKTAVPPAP